MTDNDEKKKKRARFDYLRLYQLYTFTESAPTNYIQPSRKGLTMPLTGCSKKSHAKIGREHTLHL